MNAYIRTKLGLTEQEPTIKPYDQDLWVPLPDNRLPVDWSLFILEGTHARWTTLWRSLTPAQFNRVFQAKRQPGSVFKPFVYLAALMYGGQSGTQYTPDSVLNDSQFTWSYDGQNWQPTNYNNEYFGAVTFRRALENSLNSATGRLAQDVGIRRVRDTAYRLGIQSTLPAVPSLALGSGEVTVTRTICEPAFASANTCAAVAGASAVSVLVMDCTTTGKSEPIGTMPSHVVTVWRRCPKVIDLKIPIAGGET